MAYSILFVVMFIVVSLLFIVLLPMAFNFNNALWLNAEPMQAKGIIEANKINDVNVRNAVLGVFGSGVTAFVDSQTIIGLFMQYGIFFVIGIIVVMIILLARRQVETGLV